MTGKEKNETDLESLDRIKATIENDLKHDKGDDLCCFIIWNGRV